MKAETAFSWLSLDSLETFLLYLFIVFLPTQFGKHFWLPFSFVLGQRVDYLAPTIYLTDIFVICLFFVTIIRKKLSIPPLFSLGILFMSLNIFFSQSPLAGWYLFLKIIEAIFIVWCIGKIPFKNTTMGILLFLGIFFESTLSVAQTVNQGSLGGVFYFLGERTFDGSTPGVANASIQGQLILRPYGTFSHPNMLAGYLLVAMLLVSYFIFKKKFFRTMLFLSLLFGTIGIALSLSRASIIAWAIVGVVALVVGFRGKLARAVIFSSLAVVAALILSVAFFPSFILRLATFPFGQSLTERSILARSALNIIFLHPFFGVGLNNFISTLPLISKNVILLQPVHNIYLLIAAELGLPGLMIFLGILWNAFLYIKKRMLLGEKSVVFLGFAFFSILFLGFFDHYFITLQQGQLLLVTCLGLIFSQKNFPHDTMKK